MILYDQNHNFIGMSNETLSYLGYEDLSDFTSQHSDFANLLVNKEGFIYKFQNFSWIDFILYSGSPNKSALLQLKTGSPLEIKLSVKEVHLINELGGNSKFYSIRILSDNFVNIAAKTDASITKLSPPENSFNLNSLITEKTPSPKVSEPEINLPVIEEPAEEAKSEAKSDFILNFPSSDSLKEQDSPVKLDLTDSTQEEEASENDFKLNLSGSIFDTQETSQVKGEHTEEPTPIIKEEKEQEETLDFLKPSESQNEPLLQESSTTTGFKLKNAIQTPIIEEAKEEKITLNFLKQDDEIEEEPQELQSTNTFSFNIKQEEEIQEQEEIQAPKEKVDLNFLKQETNSENEQTETIVNKDQIIAQIQNDIKEIDEVVQVTPQEPKEEEKKEEIFDGELDAYLFNKNEVKKEKKSFTKTLKSLFAETSTFPQENVEETFIEVYKEPEAVLKQEPRTHTIQTESLHRLPALASLGLEKEDEDDLISEFIHDTQSNITLFKDFYKSGNEDQAEYTLIKMQSSASILNLNDIIITLAQVKQSCTDHDIQSIEELTDTLETQVKTLESYIESETV